MNQERQPQAECSDCRKVHDNWTKHYDLDMKMNVKKFPYKLDSVVSTSLFTAVEMHGPQPSNQTLKIFATQFLGDFEKNVFHLRKAFILIFQLLISTKERVLSKHTLYFDQRNRGQKQSFSN
ncbi:hypothetical protein CBL_07002 [Carabus blaptoides fortunei]